MKEKELIPDINNNRKKKKGFGKMISNWGIVLLFLTGVFAVSFVSGYIFYKNNEYIPIIEKKSDRVKTQKIDDKNIIPSENGTNVETTGSGG